MASAAREYRYAHREFSTNGSLARDLDWAVRERELEHAGEVPRHERTQAAPKVYHKEQVLVRERQAIPVLSVLGVTAVAVAAVMLLLSYVQLTTLAADTVALKSELTVLQAENVSLTAQHVPGTITSRCPFTTAIICTRSEVLIYCSFCGKNTPVSSLSIISLTNCARFSI